jgi:uncharacterized membrane protein YgcG
MGGRRYLAESLAAPSCFVEALHPTLPKEPLMKRALPIVGSTLALVLVAAPAVASFVPPPGNGGNGGNGGTGGAGGRGGNGGAGAKEAPKKDAPKKDAPKKEEPKKPS